MDFYLYNRTSEILKDFEYINEGVDFKKMITFDLAYYLLNNKNIISKIKYIIKLFFSFKCIGFWDGFVNNKIVFSLSQSNRKDYIEMINFIRIDIERSKLVFVDKCFKRCFSFLNLFLLSYVVKAVWKCNCDISTKIFIAFQIFDYQNSLKSFIASKPALMELDNKYSYIPFNSSRGFENMITQYLNGKNVKTFHLCHGLHFSPNYKRFTIDAFNKELISANTVLSWGKAFVDNDKKYYKHNYIHEIVSNPKYSYHKINISFSTDSCVVFLARKQYQNNNMYLLEELFYVSKRIGTKFIIKPHPSLDMALMRKVCKEYGFKLYEKSTTIRDLLLSEKFGFSISYESTAYFEAMFYDLICFRYSKDENEAYGDLDNRFCNGEELMLQIKKYERMNMKEISLLIEDTLVYELGIGVNRYKEVIG